MKMLGNTAISSRPQHICHTKQREINALIVSPFFAKREMDPSDFRSKKLATLYAFGGPRSPCVRPVSVLRFATHSNKGLPQMTGRRVGCPSFCLRFRSRSNSDKTRGPTATRGSSYIARPLPLPRLPCTPSLGEGQPQARTRIALTPVSFTLTLMRLASPPMTKDTTGVLLLKGRGRENT